MIDNYGFIKTTFLNSIKDGPDSYLFYFDYIFLVRVEFSNLMGVCLSMASFLILLEIYVKREVEYDE